VIEKQPYLRNGKAYEIQTWYAGGYDNFHHPNARWSQRSKVNQDQEDHCLQDRDEDQDQSNNTKTKTIGIKQRYLADLTFN